MIIKILSSASNFEGIDYSERKNDLGKSQLLKAGNFEALGHHSGVNRKADYINYMKLVCDANLRVKKRQFHAVLSVKGQSYSPEKLGNIAEQYLKSMGYGENPYLIYFHKDTNNNHVHMVSTRVDKNGNKVNDRFEKLRSQKVLQQILDQDPIQETRSALQQALDYNFSTKAQFKLLLETQGFKITETGEQLNIIKYGTVQHKLKEEDIEKKIAVYTPPEDRIRQLKAIFHKYKKGMEMEAFTQKMHSKFGLELIFHQHKNHEQPYGYTIIDHKKKQIFKGAQVMPLKHLFMPVSPEGKMQLLKAHLHQFDFEKQGFTQLRNSLRLEGFQISNKGEIFSQTDQMLLSQLEKMQLDKLKYNDRLTTASTFSFDSEQEKAALAALFKVSMEGIKNLGTVGRHQKADEELKNYYRDMLLSAGQASNLNEILTERKLEIIQFQNKHFLLDRNKNQLISLSGLLNGYELDMKLINIKNLDVPFQQDINLKSASNTLNPWLQIFDLAIQESGEDDSTRRRKRKQRQL